MSYTDTLKVDQKEAIRLMKKSMIKGGITNEYMQAGIIAVVSKESGMKPKSEGGYGGTSNDRIRKIFGKRVKDLSEAELNVLKKDDEAFFNKVYGGRYGNAPNEGYKYRGRGLNQLTFKGNYNAMNKYTEEDIVANPDLVNTLEVAVECLIGYFLRNYSSKRNKLDEYNMTDMNSATSAADAVGAAYHANAGWGKNKADLERRNSNGRKRAFARVDDLVEYVQTVDENVPVTGANTPEPEPRKVILKSVGEGGNNDGEDVKAVQRLLKQNGFDLGKYGPNKDGIDGDCGKTTIKYIKKFQADNSIEESGLINPADATWKALGGTQSEPDTPPEDNTDPVPSDDNTPNDNNDNTNDTPPQSNTIKKSVGEDGDNEENDVKIVQTLLNRNGASLKVDGDCGKKTIAAIEKFQSEVAGMKKPDGLISPGKKTWKALVANAAPAENNEECPGLSEEFKNEMRKLKEWLNKWFAEIEKQQICHKDEEKNRTLLEKIQNILQES